MREPFSSQSRAARYDCRDGGPGSHANRHARRVILRSAGGGNAPSNLITLCSRHHQRGVHGGLLGIRGRAPAGLRFELGVRPGRPPLAVYLSGDRVA
jgi:hypothetical protein